MLRRLLTCVLLLAACLCGSAHAAAVTKKRPAGARPHAATTAKQHTGASAAKKRTTAAATQPSSKPTSEPKGTAAAGATAPAAGPSGHSATGAPARTATGPRRLEDIHIEGEIPAPQVLFITARDQRRFTRFHHQRYLKGSLQVGEETPLPTRIALTPNPSTPDSTP